MTRPQRRTAPRRYGAITPVDRSAMVIENPRQSVLALNRASWSRFQLEPSATHTACLVCTANRVHGAPDSPGNDKKRFSVTIIELSIGGTAPLPVNNSGIILVSLSISLRVSF